MAFKPRGNIIADNIPADMAEKTDSLGQVCFEELKPGLYFALADTVTDAETRYVFDSALVALPGLGADGRPQYQVTVASKSEMIPPSGTDAYP